MIAQAFQTAADLLRALMAGPSRDEHVLLAVALLIVLPLLLAAVPHTMRRVRRERGY